MANSTANRYDLAQVLVATREYLVGAGVHIYKGIMVAVNGGYLVPSDDSSGNVLVGISEQEVDNTAGGPGALSCTVSPLAELAEIEVYANTPLQTWVGQLVYAADDHSAQLAGTAAYDIVLGRCTSVVKTGSTGKITVDVTQRV
jgi:hypothetical protein